MGEVAAKEPQSDDEDAVGMPPDPAVGGPDILKHCDSLRRGYKVDPTSAGGSATMGEKQILDGSHSGWTRRIGISLTQESQ